MEFLEEEEELSREEIRELALREAHRLNIPERIAIPMVIAESSFDPYAVSPKGAKGLTQMTPIARKDVMQRSGTKGFASVDIPEDADIHDPETNLALGFAHLYNLNKLYGGGRWDRDGTARTLAAFNAGDSKVKEWDRAGVDFAGGGVPFPETRDYIDKILRMSDEYSGSVTSEEPRDFTPATPAEPEEAAAKPPVDRSKDHPFVFPDGSRGSYPPDMTHAEAYDWFEKEYPERFVTPESFKETTPVTQFQAAAWQSFANIPVAAKYVWAELTDDEELYDEAASEMIENSREAARIRGVNPIDIEAVEKAYEEGGSPAAVAKMFGLGAEQIAATFGHLSAPTAASAVVGAAVGGVGGFLSPVPGGTAAGALTGSVSAATTTASVLRWLGFAGTMQANFMASNVESA